MSSGSATKPTERHRSTAATARRSAAPPRPIRSPSDACRTRCRTWLPASYLLSLPIANATQIDVASYALGAARDRSRRQLRRRERAREPLDDRRRAGRRPAHRRRRYARPADVPRRAVRHRRRIHRARSHVDRRHDRRAACCTAPRSTRSMRACGWAGPPTPRHAPRSRRRRTTCARGVVDAGPDASASLVATGPLAHAALRGTRPASRRACDARTSRSRRRTLVDRDGDGVPDGLPGIVTTDPIERDARTPTDLRRAGDGARRLGSRRRITSSSRSSARSFDDTRFLFNSTLQAAASTARTLVGDAIATWREHVARHAPARAGRVAPRAAPRVGARPVGREHAAAAQRVRPDRARARIRRSRGACSDTAANDRFPKLTNCPIPIGWFASGGAGPLADTTGDRPSLTADIAHRFGNNVVRAGATGEDTRLVTETRFTGGAQIRSLFPGHMSERQFLDPDSPCERDRPLPDRRLERSLRYRTRYTAAYARGHVARRAEHPGRRRHALGADVGRLGAALLERARAAARRQLGSARQRPLARVDEHGPQLRAAAGRARLRRSCGAIATVDTTTSPFGDEPVGRDRRRRSRSRATSSRSTQDELTAGVELAILQAVRATAWAQGRWLRSGLDGHSGRLRQPRPRPGGTPALAQHGDGRAVELATEPDGQIGLASRLHGRLMDGSARSAPGRILHRGLRVHVAEPRRSAAHRASATALI